MINDSAGAVEAKGENPPSEPLSVGARLRKLRTAYRMSQRKLAGLSGVTNGSISMIEQDRVSPSVASLRKILEAFGLSLLEFFADDFEPETQFFFKARELTCLANGPVILRQVGANLSNRKLQVLHEHYEPGGDTGPAMLSHQGEEAGIVVRGSIEITVAGQSQILKAGDGYCFNSRLPHRFRNKSDAQCEIVSSCTPPTF